MGSNSSCFVEIQISNNTQNITLKDPRIYFGHGHCSESLQPELFPGCSDTCSFWGDSDSGGVSGVLVYEADSFSLAIHFSNPIDYYKHSLELGLELSPRKAHLGDLEATYTRMATGIYSNSCQDIKFSRVTLAGSHETTWLSHGPIKVTATMASDTGSKFKVVLEEGKGLWEKAEREKPQDFKGDRSKRSEKKTDPIETL